MTKLGISVIAFLLTCIVGMMGWYLPRLANKVDINMEREQVKLDQIFEIKSSVLGLNNKVQNIDHSMSHIKKKNEYIYKNITDRLDIMASDIKTTKQTSQRACDTLEEYAEMMKWKHPGCDK